MTEKFVPMLTVIIPIYNAAATIERTVLSLACIAPHNRSRVKVVAVDDGSTDASAQLFQQASREVTGIEFCFISQTNGGSSSARNRALETFSAGWTLFLDADDELAIDPLPLLDKYSSSSALIFDAEYFSLDRPAWKTRATSPPPGVALKRAFSAHNPYCILSVISRRELLDSLFDEELKYVEDWHFWAMNPRVFANAKVLTGTALGRIHVGSGNKSADQYRGGEYRIMAIKKMQRAWQNNVDRVIRNNFKLQKTIGNIQMGAERDYTSLLALPCTPFLYFKVLVYLFFYRLYLKTYVYK